MKKRYVLKAEVKDEILGMSFVIVPIIMLFAFIFITR